MHAKEKEKRDSNKQQRHTVLVAVLACAGCMLGVSDLILLSNVLHQTTKQLF
jgi:hypothetical protein